MLNSNNTKSEYMKPNTKRSRFSAPLMFVVIVFAAIFIMSVSFRVSDIQVKGNSHYTDSEIINAIDIEEGDNLFFFDRFAAVSRVFAKLPYVEEVSITRNLPNKVIIEVSESKAMAYIKLGAEMWTFDHNCKLLGKATEVEYSNLINVIGFDPGTLYIGELLTQSDGNNDVVDYIVEILTQIQDRNLSSQIEYINISDKNNVVIEYDGRYKIIIGSETNLERKFSMAVASISQLKEGDVGILNVSDGVYSKFSPF